MKACDPTPEQQDKILCEAARGQTIAQICDTFGFERYAFLRWRKRNPDFEKALQEALDEGTEAQVDGVCTIAEEIEDSQRAKVHGDHLLKVASKRLRARYGDSLHLTGDVKVDLVGVLKGVRARKEKLTASRSDTSVSPVDTPFVVDAEWERLPASAEPDLKSGAPADDDEDDIFR